MIKPRIIVTGATGKTGSLVLSELLNAGYPVRAIVHREDGRSARLKAQGAEVRVSDVSDVERIADALKDVQRAYFCPPYDPYMIHGAVAFATAASSPWRKGNFRSGNTWHAGKKSDDMKTVQRPRKLLALARPSCWRS